MEKITKAEVLSWFDLLIEDKQFVESILPKHYEVKQVDSRTLNCKSSIGIKQSPYLNPSTGNMVTDAEDEEHWSYIFNAIKSHFGDRFLEVYHLTCFCHVNFNIYLKKHHWLKK